VGRVTVVVKVIDVLHGLACWPGNHLLVARVDGEIMARLTLVTFPIPTGLRLAHAAGARTVDLTSRPSRTEANRLYERLGFRVRDSKLYRLGEVPSI
jgi:hypothetical protein